MQEHTSSSQQQDVVIITDPQPETTGRTGGTDRSTFVMKIIIVGFAVVVSALGLSEVINASKEL